MGKKDWTMQPGHDIEHPLDGEIKVKERPYEGTKHKSSKMDMKKMETGTG